MSQQQTNHLRDRRLKLMVIEDDPAVRLGLVACLKPFPDLQVVWEADSIGVALRVLQTVADGATQDGASLPLPDVILLSLDLGYSQAVATGLSACQILTSRYPSRPLLLLGAHPHPTILATAIQSGARGYCAKTTECQRLVQIVYQIAAGQTYWDDAMQAIAQTLTTPPATLRSLPPAASFLASVRQNLRQSGLQQIDAAIAHLNHQLQASDLPILDHLVITGHRRELRTARWLVNRLLPPVSPSAPPSPSPLAPPTPPAPPDLLPAPPTTLRSLQASLFDTLASRLQTSLYNLTESPLEIDILKGEKKRELLYLILRKLEDLLNELQMSQVTIEQLTEKRSELLLDLWRATTSDFFGKYTTLDLGDRTVEIVPALLQDADIVQFAILNKIPFVADLFAHLLFQIPLTIDETSYGVGTVEAMVRVELLLQHLIIQVANAVIQPLLNQFGNQIQIKQMFYDKRLLSTREIERFRNNLSWKYRVAQWLDEPTAMFESRFHLLEIDPQGIIKTPIYAPRNQELEQLQGLQLAVTLVLELRDAIAPRFRSAVSLLGSGVVYLLTEVVGRGIGLIGRGIVKGIGNALQDTRFSRNDQRSR